mmetsp:Transcript_22948/g.39343  ORF Transcript_22948/g.39343 Transcript_22948/m.39343 type:complete len:203 (-) Transcript_22948:699-1307(-)
MTLTTQNTVAFGDVQTKHREDGLDNRPWLPLRPTQGPGPLDVPTTPFPRASRCCHPSPWSQTVSDEARAYHTGTGRTEPLDCPRGLIGPRRPHAGDLKDTCLRLAAPVHTANFSGDADSMTAPRASSTQNVQTVTTRSPASSLCRSASGSSPWLAEPAPAVSLARPPHRLETVFQKGTLLPTSHRVILPRTISKCSRCAAVC